MRAEPAALPRTPPVPHALAALSGRDREQPATVEWRDEEGAGHRETYSCYVATLEIAKQLEYLALGHADRIILADGGIVDGPFLRREIEGHR